MGVGYNPKIVTDGLVLCLDAANKKSYSGSGSVWRDLSGYDNHAYLNNINFLNKNKGIIKTIGTSDPIVIPDAPSLQFTQQFTLCIWVKFNNVISEYYRTLFGKPSYLNYGIIVEWYGDNELLVDFLDTSSQRNGLGGFFPSLTDWNFISYSYKMNGGDNNQAVHIWKGNKLESYYATVAPNTQILTDNENMYISSEFLNIEVASACAYNRSLSFQEILQNYKALKGRFNL